MPAWIRPAWVAVAAGLVALAALAALGGLLRAVTPKMAAVAWTTAKEALAQPLFYVLLFIGAVYMALACFMPYNTLGEDIKLVKDGGLTVIMVLSTILAVWTASVSVAEEIEGRIAVTVLSKPIGRREFIFGKFLGILAPVVFLFVVLGTLFLASVSYKVVYDARETASPEPTAADCQKEIVQVLPGLPLAFMVVVVLSSIALAISTRLPMVPNLVICAAVYALGHLLPTLVREAAQGPAIPYFMAQLLATVLPVLDNFNMYTAISAGKEVPLELLGWAGVYCAIYTTVALLGALLLFEDRDLA
jgi:ABC-type transport system involved in multi-copper enzyme maturation permease subunit